VCGIVGYIGGRTYPGDGLKRLESRYRNPVIEDDTPATVLSQSGETADTLAALREAKRRGALTLAV